MFFLCLNSRSRDQGSPKLAHMTHSLIPTLSPNFTFYVLQFANTEQINPPRPKFANQNESTTLLREVPIN